MKQETTFRLFVVSLCLCLLLPACSPNSITIGDSDPVTQLDNVSVYATVTGEETALEDLPTFVGGKYRGAKPGRYGLITHTFTKSLPSFISGI